MKSMINITSSLRTNKGFTMSNKEKLAWTKYLGNVLKMGTSEKRSNEICINQRLGVLWFSTCKPNKLLTFSFMLFLLNSCIKHITTYKGAIYVNNIEYYYLVVIHRQIIGGLDSYKEYTLSLHSACTRNPFLLPILNRYPPLYWNNLDRHKKTFFFLENCMFLEPRCIV